MTTELELAKGVKDTPPEEKLIKNEVIDRIKKIFELYGYLPLETTILERYETLAAKFGAGEASDALKEVFKLQDQGGRNLALRFDLTVPLARYMALNPTIKLPFKRYEVGPVFRDGPIKLGRTREFWQMDIDVVGTSSMLADAEIIAMTSAVFAELEFDVFIKVNNRKLLNGILEDLKITNKEEVLISLDKLDKIGKEGVSKELLEKKVSKKQIEGIFDILQPGITLKELKNKIKDKQGLEGIEELEEIFLYLEKMGIKNVLFDLSLSRGLAYYTGTVFEAYLKEGIITSSLAGGGRYDEMIGKYMASENKVPAVGISFGLVPIMAVLKNIKKELILTPSKVYVLPIGVYNESLALVQTLRNKGIASEIDLTKRGISKNLAYAGTLGIPYVIFVGENEVKQGRFKLRDMKTGEEELLLLNEILKKLNSSLTKNL